MTTSTQNSQCKNRRRFRVDRLVALLVTVSAAGGCDQSKAPAPRVIPIPEKIETLRPALVELIQKHADVVRSDMDNPVAIATLGLVYEANGLWGEARDCYAWASSLAPDEPMWVYHQAVARKMWGDPPGSLSLLRQAAAKFPDFAPLQWGLGDALADAGLIEEAKPAFERTIELAPDKCEGYVSLADILIRTGDYSAAFEELKKGIRLDPYYKSARYTLGRALRGLGQLEEAERQLRLGTSGKKRNMEDAWGEHRMTYNLTVSSMLGRSDQLMNAGQLDEALAILKRALSLDPDDLQILNQLAAAYLMGGQYDLAEEALLRAKLTDDANLGIYINLAACYLGMNKPNKALQAAKRAMEIDASLWEVPFNLGLAHSKLKEYDAGYKALQAALALEPPGASVHLAMADVCLALNLLDEAKLNYQIGMDRDPRSALAAYGLCRTFIKLGDWVRAQEALGALIALVPGDPAIPVLTRQIDTLQSESD